MQPTLFQVIAWRQSIDIDIGARPTVNGIMAEHGHAKHCQEARVNELLARPNKRANKSNSILNKNVFFKGYVTFVGTIPSPCGHIMLK